MPKAEADDNIELPALEGTAPLSAVVTRPSHEPVARSASRSVWAWGAVVALVAVAATGLALRRTTPESAQAPTVQAVVQLSFEAKPGGTVYIDGRAYGDTPTTVELPRADKPLMVEIRRPGHVTSSQRVVPSVDQRIVVVLEPLPAPTSTPSAVPSPAPNRAPVYRHRPPPRPSPPAASSAPKRVELL
jgi:hypothetical protein